MWLPKLRTPLAEGIPPAVCSFCLSSEPASETRHHAGQQRHKYKQVRWWRVPKELAVLHGWKALLVIARQNFAEAGGDWLHFTDEETETQRHLSELPVVLAEIFLHVSSRGPVSQGQALSCPGLWQP